MKSLVGKKVGQDFMIYDPEKDCVHVLNPVAYRIYQLRHEGCSVETIAVTLRSEFNLAPDYPVLMEIEEGIRSLDRLGLA